jgi:ADP-dependent NAD(P)H-hydrate dehydratase / NAD(P)H-hydrate epimerase
MITTAEMRELEEICEERGLSNLQLMENVGYEIAEELILRFKDMNRHFLILCGTGNNGGDGMAAARFVGDHPVLVGLVGKKSKLTPESSVQYRKVRSHKIPVLEDPKLVKDALKKTTPRTIIIDALIGVGMKGKIREPLASIIKAANKAKGRIISIDTPSGINPDTGMSAGAAIRPDYIIALHDTKPGLKQYKKKVVIRPIGIPKWAIAEYQKRHHHK